MSEQIPTQASEQTPDSTREETCDHVPGKPQPKPLTVRFVLINLLVFLGIAAFALTMVPKYQAQALEAMVKSEARTMSMVLLERAERLNDGIVPLDKAAAQGELDVYLAEEDEEGQEFSTAMKSYEPHEGAEDFTLCVERGGHYALLDTAIAAAADEDEKGAGLTVGEGTCAEEIRALP